MTRKTLIAAAAALLPLLVACTPLPAGGPPQAAFSPADTAARAVEQDLLQRLNDERAARGLPALAWNESVTLRARAWSRDMAANGLRHGPYADLLATYGAVAENVGRGQGGTFTAGSLHVLWMGSSGHRANMLSPAYDQVGIGVVCGPDRTMWATVDFVATGPGGPAPPPPPADPVVRGDAGTTACP